MYDKFQGELLKDEQILWTGQPETSVLFSRSDILLIPFSLFWGGFAIFWEFCVLFSKDESGQGAPVFFALFGIPFILMGLYMIFGRFIWKKYNKRRTFYAITNKRVIVLTEALRINVKAEFIDRISSINKSVRRDGIGTVRFGSSNMTTEMYGNTGMEIFTTFYGPDVPVFYDIKDANQVYETVNNIRKQ